MSELAPRAVAERIADTMPDSACDCVVIGAGFSGLAAASTLQHGGLSVRLLEARSRVGGRTEPGHIAGHTIDLGGMWLGPTQKRLDKLARSCQVRTYPMWLRGVSEISIEGRRVKAEGEAVEKALPLLDRLKLAHLAGELERLSRSIDCAEPWAAPGAHDLDSMTVVSWAERHVRSKRVRTLLDLFVRAIFCCESAQLSMLFFLFYLRGGGGLETLIKGGDGGAQNLLFHGGLHQIAVRLAQNIGSSVRLDFPVDRIDQDDDLVRVYGRGEVVRAGRAIVATPPGLTQQIAFTPDLPHTKRGLLQRQPMGACIKIWIAYETPFWRKAGLNGMLADHAAPFTPVFDVTPPDAGVGLLAGFFEGDGAFAHGDAAWRRQAALETLRQTFGDAALRPIDYVERDWTQERWSQGCYGAHMGPGTLTRYGTALRAPFGRIHWAGTETAREWSGYVEGAIEAGERAATEVLALARA